MRFLFLAISAAIGVLLVALLDVLFVRGMTTESRFLYNAIMRVALLAVTAFAAGLAAHKFGWWNEYAGRAWTLFFVEFALLTVSEILRRFFVGANLAYEIAVVIANLAAIGAYILIARSLRAAGLESTATPLVKTLVFVAALVLAVLLCKDAMKAGYDSLSSDTPRLSRLVSPAADVVTFLLVAPLLLTALALRGGQLSWIFGSLTLGTIGWMVNQGADFLATLAGAGDDAVRAFRMIGFAMACLFIAAAALTQWLAARRASSAATFQPAVSHA
jgi:hypothetical protein